MHFLAQTTFAKGYGGQEFAEYAKLKKRRTATVLQLAHNLNPCKITTSK